MKRIAHQDQRVNRPTPAAHSAGRTVSRADLEAANARLLALRAQRATTPRSEPTETVLPPAIPSHLGWGSQQFTRQIARTTAEAQPSEPQHTVSAFVTEPEPAIVCDKPVVDLTYRPNSSQTISIYPSITTAILKSEQAAAGRIWLLCRHLDHDGQGWLTVQQLREQLTKPTLNLKVVGWRRLRQLLTAGEGVFWERRCSRSGEDRLWLFGIRRLCQALEIEHLSGERVELPLAALVGNIGKVRAALYATFHAGRVESPISRATLTEVTGVSERGQRTYDKQCQVTARPNYSLIAPYSAETQRIQTYQTMTPHFTFTDHRGRHGAVGKQYTARQLPNSYTTSWQRSPSSQKRKLNKRLKQDLVHNGTQGNSFNRYERVFVGKEQRAKKITGNQYIHDQGRFWIYVDPKPNPSEARINQ